MVRGSSFLGLQALVRGRHRRDLVEIYAPVPWNPGEPRPGAKPLPSQRAAEVTSALGHVGMVRGSSFLGLQALVRGRHKLDFVEIYAPMPWSFPSEFWRRTTPSPSSLLRNALYVFAGFVLSLKYLSRSIFCGGRTVGTRARRRPAS